MMSSHNGKKAKNTPGQVSHCMKTVGSGSMVHGKSSGLELLNIEERVLFATMVPLPSTVLPSCVSQYFRQYEAFEVADDTSRLLAESCL